MNEDASAALILERAAVPNKNHVFVLGCYAKRVTFHSQQNRALNLVWALFHEGKIKRQSKIAIVGAGLAGITGAVAANSKGGIVDLYEASDEIMHIQRGNWTRYIHPNIYDWPKSGCDKDLTDLPFLNWSAGVTDNVVGQIEAEWNKLREGINFKTQHKVTSISEANGKPRVTVIDPFSDEAYDCIIVAAGFGKEKTMDYIKPRSYWSSDDLHQNMTSDETPQNFLISGCGDGGLIDALRLSIKNFRHDLFTKEFLEDNSLTELNKKLIEIENKIPDIQTDISRFIFDEYKKLNIPSDLLKKIKKNVRSDTKVTLIGTSATPFIPNSSLLNRFAVFLLQQIGKVSYREARLVKAESNKLNYNVTLACVENAQIELPFDQVVLRHGPKPVINNLVTSEPDKKGETDSLTAGKLWPDNFYPLPPKPLLTKFQVAEEHRSSLLDRVKKSKNLTEIGVAIGGTQENPLYIVTYRGELKTGFINLENWEGIPVVWHEAPTFMSSMSITIKMRSSFKAKFDGKLEIGAPIRNKTAKGGIGTLGCFVSFPNGRTGILSTNHVLLGNLKSNLREASFEINQTDIITTVDRDTQTDYEIASLYKAIPVIHITENEKSKSILTNVSDAAVAKLNPGIAFSPLFNVFERELNITEVGDPIPGINVYKLGASSGITEGKISSVYGTYSIVGNGKRVIFKDAILVEGEKQHFSTDGDSGALVFDNTGTAYGIVMACSGKLTLVCPLKPILDSLECRLYATDSLSKL
jgi:hypothetical protein